MTAENTKSNEGDFASRWNHAPEVPIKVSPIFSWPLDLMQICRWMLSQWLIVTERSILILIALGSWFWFQPPLDQMASLSLDWVALLYIRNMVLMIFVAGCLHLFFYSLKVCLSACKVNALELFFKSTSMTLGNRTCLVFSLRRVAIT